MASAAAWQPGLYGCWALVTFPCRGLTGTRHDGKAKDQFRAQMQPLPTPNRGRVWSQRQQQTSATARNTHGNEGQDVAALVAGRCVHGAKNNRVAS